MSRRILDNVTITALSKDGDESLAKSIYDVFGEGTIVPDAKTKAVMFNTSSLGLQPTTLSPMIRRIAKEFSMVSTDCEFIDNNGIAHSINYKVLSILKALAFYQATCAEAVCPCINKVLEEVEYFLRKGEYKNLTLSCIDNDDHTVVVKDNLLSYCREEVFNLLREAGLEIG